MKRKRDSGWNSFVARTSKSRFQRRRFLDITNDVDDVKTTFQIVVVVVVVVVVGVHVVVVGLRGLRGTEKLNKFV